MSDKNESRDEYEVGYGKPPMDHRFKPGMSGNPTGRSKNKLERAMSRIQLSEDVLTAMERKVVIGRHGKQVRVPYVAAFIESLQASAIKGDKSARKQLMDLHLLALSTRASLLGSSSKDHWEFESIAAQRDAMRDPSMIEVLNKYRRRTRLK